MPMDACYSCHQEKKVTIACLDCHRQHHSYPSTTELVQGWFGNLPFSGVLLTLAGLVGVMGAYTYMDMRLARRWLASLEEPPPAPNAAGQHPLLRGRRDSTTASTGWRRRRTPLPNCRRSNLYFLQQLL